MIQSQKELLTPVLFLIFNRPAQASEVFQAIRQAKPQKLYIASDGPRDNQGDEEEKVKEVRDIVSNIDWDCELKTLYREKNLGCKKAVSDAITWFFENENEGIILEDDCLPEQSFFYFCQDLLERYRHDSRIMAISGNNFQGGSNSTAKSYYFSRYPHCWGWASWKRAWDYWDGDFVTWPEVISECILLDIAGGDELFVDYWNKIFDKCYAGEIDSWAYPWTYSCLTQSGLTILPSNNLVSNIGFGEESTHTCDSRSPLANMGTVEMTFPLIHPSYVVRETKADKKTDELLFRIGKNPSKSHKGFISILRQILRIPFK